MARTKRERDLIQTPAELAQLTEQIGEFIEYWGFKKIHGKLWAHLYIAAQPLDAGDLIHRLQVSKALVSITLSDLLRYKVIREAGKSSAGTLLYEANPHVLAVIVNVLRERERALLRRIEGSFDQVSALAEETRVLNGIQEQKLQQLGSMIKSACRGLDSFLSIQNHEAGPQELAFMLEFIGGSSDMPEQPKSA